MFPLLGMMTDAIIAHHSAMAPYMGKGNMAVEYVDIDRLKADMFDFFDRMYRDRFDTHRWCDKTPGVEMIRVVPMLHAHWPDARFIFCKRRGVENVSSQMRKFASSPGSLEERFDEACFLWAGAMEEWRRVSKGIDPSAYIEIDQADVAKQPVEVAAQIAILTGASERARAAIATTLANRTPEVTGQNYDWQEMEDHGWTASQRHRFEVICRHAMDLYGYRLDLAAGSNKVGPRLLSYSDDRTLVEIIDLEPAPDVLLDERGTFMLHPRNDHISPRVIFKNVDLHGHTSFYCRLEIRHAASAPVNYFLRILESRTGKEKLRREATARAQELVDWTFEFAPLDGTFDVEFSTHMTNGARNSYAWAHIMSPRFGGAG